MKTNNQNTKTSTPEPTGKTLPRNMKYCPDCGKKKLVRFVDWLIADEQLNPEGNTHYCGHCGQTFLIVWGSEHLILHKDKRPTTPTKKRFHKLNHKYFSPNVPMNKDYARDLAKLINGDMTFDELFEKWED